MDFIWTRKIRILVYEIHERTKRGSLLGDVKRPTNDKHAQRTEIHIDESPITKQSLRGRLDCLSEARNVILAHT